MSNSSTEEKLNRLLELKLIPDHQRTNKEQLELQTLTEQHKSYANLNAKDLQKELRPKSDLQILFVLSSSKELILDYEKIFSNKPGYKKPSQEQNNIQAVTLNNDQNAETFLQSQLSKGRSFKVLDAQRNVLAFSPGKGILQPLNSRNAVAVLANMNSNTNINLANRMQNSNNSLLNQNQMLQQGVIPRPLLTRPSSTFSSHITLLNANARSPVKAAGAPLQPMPTGKKPNEISPQSPYAIPTPFKKTPYDK